MILRPLFQWRPYRGEGILATVVKYERDCISSHGISYTLYKFCQQNALQTMNYQRAMRKRIINQIEERN